MNATPKPAAPDQKEEQPKFVFFRSTPTDMMNHPPLASSLQSFESCLLLIALGRFPNALASCAAAVESVIKAKLGTPPEDKVRMSELIEEIRRRSVSLRLFDEAKLEDFRETRNHVVHYGYTPKDDEVCAVQLLETGFPFLEKCYEELFGFALLSKSVNAPVVGLEPKLREQYRVCRDVYRRARALRGIGYLYCFGSLAHCVRFGLKDITMTVAERNMMEIDEEMGVKFDHERRVKQRIERAFTGPTREFDCPICGGQSSMIAELDEDALRDKRVSVRQCMCVSCEMLVCNGSPYLADELLRVPVKVETEFLKEFGI